MILQTVVNALTTITIWIINLSPSATPTDIENIEKMTNIFIDARNIFNWVNFFFPVDTLFQIIGLFILVEFISFVFKVSRWIGSILSAGLLK